MGCDIHFYVEKKVDGKWVTADTWYDDKYSPGEKTIYPEDFMDRTKGPIYYDRNYDLFGILANVRNGSGFAGVDTGNGFVPIHELRGVPEDSCQEILKSAADWDADGHSHSWATVQELMEYDWTRTTKKRGWVSPKEFGRFVLEGRPSSWSGMVSGGGIEHLSNEEMMKHISPAGEKFTWRDFHAMKEEGVFSSKYTQVEWQVHYYESARNFLSETLPKLWRMGKPEDVRCVYWFDN